MYTQGTTQNHLIIQLKLFYQLYMHFNKVPKTERTISKEHKYMTCNKHCSFIYILQHTEDSSAYAHAAHACKKFMYDRLPQKAYNRVKGDKPVRERSAINHMCYNLHIVLASKSLYSNSQSMNSVM